MSLRSVTIVSAIGSTLLTFLPAQAQYVQGYAVPGPYPYAIAVAPGAYAIRSSRAVRDYPYVNCGRVCSAPAGRHMHARTYRRSRPVASEEGRRDGRGMARRLTHTTAVVRDPPVVVQHVRVVNDAPRVIERRRYVGDAPAARAGGGPHESDALNGGVSRVIHAEAEVTILGPDRMTIRLFRKRGVQARAQGRQ